MTQLSGPQRRAGPAADPDLLDPSPPDALSGFLRLWAIAVLLHIAGNPPLPGVRPDGDLLRPTLLLLGLAALWLFARPSSRRAAVATALLTLVSVWFEAPLIGNHWLLAGFVSAGLLIAFSKPDPWAWFVPTGRLMLLGFYSFAAFAKLNSGFFDPIESCARFYANQSLEHLGLPELGGEALPFSVAVLTAAIELSVPLLLLVRRTRVVGVLLGLGFHFVVSLDFGQHFYDFSSVLFALFVLFLADDHVRRLGALRLAPVLQVIVTMTFGLIVVLVALSDSYTGLARVLGFGPWIGYASVVLIRVSRHRVAARVDALEVASLSAGLLLVFVLANGVSPYLDIKSATSWNMYANLATSNGASNHFVVPSTWSAGAGPTYVEVLETSDDQLAQYIDSGYVVPLRNLESYLADHREAEVTVQTSDGEIRTVRGDEVSGPSPFLDKFVSHRSVDTSASPRCQTVFLPAR